ncbi:DUF2476 domain-containing protein [Novosphingobium sp. 1949]|uniref:DUF2476 domain-containing protein n=1 Tax=Novosphingobium organovorum TaxID=2930092 RepID=A0ABT0BHL6_9SPHN|nr:DUF2476 domain-containing protein [Novosphingobium organovorum]MCJ2184519.1 DUF2476 domain-containing protein [Novosphingobium organovorum]
MVDSLVPSWRALAAVDAFDVLRSLIVAGCALALILAGVDLSL